MIEMMPTGIFMKKIQFQDQLSVIHPPRKGPMIGPNMMPIPKMAIAVPCCDGGKVSRSMDWDMG